MHIRRFIILFALFGGGSQAAERWRPYEIVEPDSLQLPKLSVIGKQVLSDPEEWLIGRSEHFLVFAKQRHELQNAVDDAEHALERSGKWFNLDVEGMPMSLLVFVQDANQWSTLMRGHGLRRDSLSMQLGRELYFKDDPREPRKPERVSHEAVQLALNLAFHPLISLWLEEGLASYFGWICAVEMYNQRERLITRTLPALEPHEVIDLKDLLTMRKYPEDEAMARAFYRQSEELVAVLAEKLDQSDFAAFVHTLCSGKGSGVKAFQLAAGLDDDELDDVVREVYARCTRPKDSLK